ncbi:MAG: hypothetical protein Q4G27_07610 [Flavobacteriaceae bacterium]|nr:hypothetical protein [Flavobacteriaceae bacterium]
MKNLLFAFCMTSFALVYAKTNEVVLVERSEDVAITTSCCTRTVTNEDGLSASSTVCLTYRKDSCIEALKRANARLLELEAESQQYDLD